MAPAAFREAGSWQQPDSERLPQSNDAKYMVKTYSKPPIVFTRGQGCTLYDTEGARTRATVALCLR